MNWFRIILDGIAMSIMFNCAVATFWLFKPHPFVEIFPKEIQEKARPVTKKERRHTIIMCLTVYPTLVIWGVLSAWQADITGFWNLFWTAYIEMMFVSIGDLLFLDWLLLKITGTRLHAEGTEGDPFYEPKNELLKLGIPEHLGLWPILVCPFVGLVSAGLGQLLRMM